MSALLTCDKRATAFMRTSQTSEVHGRRALEAAVNVEVYCPSNLVIQKFEDAVLPTARHTTAVYKIRRPLRRAVETTAQRNPSMSGRMDTKPAHRAIRLSRLFCRTNVARTSQTL